MKKYGDALLTAACCVSNYLTINAILDENDETPERVSARNPNPVPQKKYIRADSSLVYFAFWIGFATFSVKKDFGANQLVFSLTLNAIVDGFMQILCLSFFTLIHVKPN